MMKVEQAIRITRMITNEGDGGCGTGHGGFQPGNTCAKGGSGGSSKDDPNVVTRKTAGGHDHIQDTTGRGLKAEKISQVIKGLKKGDEVSVVFTSTVGKGDAERGKEMTGKVTGFGTVKGTDHKAAILEVTSGDMGTGQKIISPLQSLHAITWGKTSSSDMDRPAPSSRVTKETTPYKGKPVSRLPPGPRRSY